MDRNTHTSIHGSFMPGCHMAEVRGYRSDSKVGGCMRVQPLTLTARGSTLVVVAKVYPRAVRVKIFLMVVDL